LIDNSIQLLMISVVANF